MLCTASYSLTLVRDLKPDSVACIYVVIIDLGDAGKHSDGGVSGNCSFHQALEDGDLDIPEDSPLPCLALCNYFITTPILSLSTCLRTISGTTGPALPYVMVGDEAFPLRRYLLHVRPYPGRNLEEQKAIFNYRLSRARRIVENAFRTLAAKCALPMYFDTYLLTCSCFLFPR